MPRRARGARAVRPRRGGAQRARSTRRRPASRSALAQEDGAWVMEVCNDGVGGRPPRTISGMGLRLAALEALQVGGLVEFGEREPGTWRVRLAVPMSVPDVNPGRIALGHAATASCACSWSTTTRSCTGGSGSCSASSRGWSAA